MVVLESVLEIVWREMTGLLFPQDKWVLDHEDIVLGKRIGQVSDASAEQSL